MTDNKTALIVEGGAMRGIFAAGVLDRFLELEYNPFDFCVGVSAGATNLAAWLCKQKGRNYKVIKDYSCRPQFISFRKYLSGGHVIDLDWLWDITIREMRLDLGEFKKNKTVFYVVVTNALDGKAEYLIPEEETLELLIKGSCALPGLYRGFPEYDDIRMADGGVADPLPVIRAYEMGAREMTVILSRPLGYRKKAGKFPGITDFMLKEKKELARAMKDRWFVYNRSIEFLETAPADCRVKIIAPPLNFEVGRLTKDPKKLEAGYQMGLEAAQNLYDLYSK
ncbi:patatin family protein [Oceanispirochaeta sp.]|jgi:predicted patatin/cPLA2 family phospholipase|uniref:patatin-like phospholipase family protein n=1 Tax=Oceanispirochaeta sp. TaxID=2035350 RepID=UPI0026109D4A|nr:patatin family protein [Oceanispirochaeta sp.]MDA3955942.1 patatin family protein [Oceanispirochaeta sp.]